MMQGGAHLRMPRLLQANLPTVPGGGLPLVTTPAVPTLPPRMFIDSVPYTHTTPLSDNGTSFGAYLLICSSHNRSC